ncbi:MAG TPA: hypothetical protein VGZ29_07925 [Terriglobia bacterium]|nr:hypothetical protein [Terriglobia bacterium]
MLQQGGNGAAQRAAAACRSFDAQLSDYLEGADRPEVTTHAADCEFCGAFLADLLLARSACGELPEAALVEEPPARIWANVRATLVAEGLIHPPGRQRAWLEWLLTPAPAAALTAVILLSLFAARSLVHEHRQAVKDVAELVVGRDVIANVSQMEAAFRAQSARLNPTIERAYEEDLASLDGEIKECKDTLARQPEDDLSREYLASAYTQKARVLESALELGDSDAR